VVRIFSYSPLLLVFFLLSCASGQREKRAELRTLYAQKEFDKAIKILEEPKLASDENLKLLLKMEKANIDFSRQNQYQANLEFNEAIDLSKKLYTEKFSQIATTGIINDNIKDFYGEKFERSLLYFFASLTSMNLSQAGKRETYVLRTGQDKNIQETVIPEYNLKPEEVRLARQSSRAQILAWDSFLSNLKNDNWGQNVYKNDLLAKIYGAFVHESMNISSDDQIALQLYKDAKELLAKNFNIYPSFNQKAHDFAAEFKNFVNHPEINVSQYIEPTSRSKELDQFLDQKIKSLSKKEKKANFKFVLQEGLIAQKVPFKVSIGLKGAMEASDDPKTRNSIASIGTTVLAVFAADKLGLINSDNTFGQNYLGVKVAELAVHEAGIDFEIPKVENKPVTQNFKLILKNDKNIVVLEKPLVLVAPLSDIAYEAVKEEALARVTKTGFRVAAKHVAAIAAAFATYKMMGGEDKDFFAKTAAIASYLAASKLITASEKADTRYWSTLPHTIRVIEGDLPAGKYTGELSMEEGESKAVIKIPDIDIQDTKEIKIVGYRHL
jgi:hypothetical protein